MNRDFIVSTCVSHRQTAADFLRQEIAFFEGRLNEMGDQGDCAYERALSTTYQSLLHERKQQLAELKVVC